MDSRICDFRPIGLVRTEASREEVRKSFEGVKGKVVIFEEFVEGLRGLEGFSHIFLITCLHEVGEEDRRVLVVRPKRFVRLGIRMEELPELGVFATDSPHRPNPIGLHLVRLLEVRENELIVDGLDAYDGTPVLDIKPYTAARRVETPSLPAWYVRLRERVGFDI